MKFDLRKATKAAAKARLALIGPAGSGKTFSALAVGQHLGDKVGVIDTENGSASKYADRFNFHVCELKSFSPQVIVGAIKHLESEGCDVIIIDSLSHSWMGKDGALDLKDKIAKGYGKNSFNAWADINPLLREMVDAIQMSSAHVIATMRSKTKWIEEDVGGKKKFIKAGVAPVMKDEIDYEFDVVGRLDIDCNCYIIKSRCDQLSGKTFNRIGAEFASILGDWLSDGDDIDENMATFILEMSEATDVKAWMGKNKDRGSAFPEEYRKRIRTAIELELSTRAAKAQESEAV